MTQDRPLLGITLMLGFCFFAPLADALAKILSDFVPLFALIVVRFFAQGSILVPFVRSDGRGMWGKRRLRRLAWIRAGLHILGIGMMFTALRFLPLADAVAIAFVMPFIMLLLGWAVLGETVGWRRLAACLVGFCGTLMVIQPAFETVGWPALLPVGVAIVFSLFMLVTRAIAKEIDPILLQVVNGWMALVLLVPIGFGFWWWGFPVLPEVMPGPGVWAMLVGIGVLGSLAHLLMTWSLRFAPSTTLAPMQYLEIPIATLFGYLIFGDWPNGLAAIGICVTIAAGIYVIWREQAMRQPSKVPPLSD